MIVLAKSGAQSDLSSASSQGASENGKWHTKSDPAPDSYTHLFLVPGRSFPREALFNQVHTHEAEKLYCPGRLVDCEVSTVTESSIVAESGPDTGT